MKVKRSPFLPLFVLCIATAQWSSAQVQTEAEPAKVTMCALYSDPTKYQGRIVAVHASVAGNDFWIDDFTRETCSFWTNVIVVYPEKVKPRPDFSLVQDESLNDFVDSMHKGKGVDATFYGRFDAVFTWHDKKRILVSTTDERGFGRKHWYGARIVLKRISDVASHPNNRR